RAAARRAQGSSEAVTYLSLRSRSYMEDILLSSEQGRKHASKSASLAAGRRSPGHDVDRVAGRRKKRHRRAGVEPRLSEPPLLRGVRRGLGPQPGRARLVNRAEPAAG